MIALHIRSTGLSCWVLGYWGVGKEVQRCVGLC
jgi:hypothetical protein